MQNLAIITFYDFSACQAFSNPEHCALRTFARKGNTTMPHTHSTSASTASCQITRFPRKYLHAVFAFAVGLCLVAASGATLARNSTGHKSTTTDTAAKKKGVSKVTYQRSSSEESRAERDRRM